MFKASNEIQEKKTELRKVYTSLNDFINQFARTEDVEELRQRRQDILDQLGQLEEERIKMVEQETKMELGDILVSSWGYDQTNAHFYQIIKISKCFVTVREIDAHRIDCLGPNNYVEVARKTPKRDKFVSNNIRRKIQQYNGEHYIKIESYEHASKWNGKPATVTFTA